jgi:hypothetical protein
MSVGGERVAKFELASDRDARDDEPEDDSDRVSHDRVNKKVSFRDMRMMASQRCRFSNCGSISSGSHEVVLHRTISNFR